MNQIRLEEVIETYRSVWWFQNGLVTDGAYALLGWYGTLAAFYNFFGISVYSPKLVKLLIEFIAFFCLAAVLKKELGVKFAWFPLLVIGFSPTLMYFNSLSLPHGTDVSYFFIFMFLISTERFNQGTVSQVRYFLTGSLIMFAALTYPGFLFFLPPAVLFLVYKIKTAKVKNLKRKLLFKPLILLLFGSASVFLLFFLHIKNRELLVFDPMFNSGLFRSYGRIELNKEVVSDNFQKITGDLFLSPASYYFEQKEVEFSGFYPLSGVIVVFVYTGFLYRRYKQYRIYTGGLLVLFVFYFLLISLIGPKTLGGIRRGTVLLIIFYTLVGITWKINFIHQNSGSKFRYFLTGAASLILIHHILVLPANIENLKQPSDFKEKWWFTGDDPEKSMNGYLKAAVLHDVYLPCQGYVNNQVQCSGLSLIYPAIKASCYYNDLLCHEIFTVDLKSGQRVKLNFEYWTNPRPGEP